MFLCLCDRSWLELRICFLIFGSMHGYGAWDLLLRDGIMHGYGVGKDAFDYEIMIGFGLWTIILDNGLHFIFSA